MPWRSIMGTMLGWRGGWWLIVVVLLAAACSPVAPTARSSSPTPRHPSSHRSSTAPDPPKRLPRGGKRVFPRYRVVAYYGTAGTGSLGVLGSKPPAQIAGKIEKVARRFATPGRQVQPAMELIVTVADATPGPDGDYNHTIAMAKAKTYLRIARANDMLLILDIQPGQAKFLRLVKHWAPLLAHPQVGLALDAEWHMPDAGVPGQTIGHVNAAQINRVAAWLADLVQHRRLPQKLFVLHQFTASMIDHIGQVTTRPQLAEVQHLDGFGAPADKLAKYRRLQRPSQFHMGFKLFYSQDTPLMSPTRVLNLNPPPEYVSYQ
ncbi:MAG: hypothetical protein ACRDMV_03580 [Streptosporangiales bacterium]